MESSERNENEIARVAVNCAFKVHKQLGPGLLESAYEAAMMYELFQQGLSVKTQIPVPVVYGGVELKVGYRIDMLVADRVILEIKSVEDLAPVHSKQLLTYLRLSNLKLGLLINFNTELIKFGIKRLVNGL